jgi:non-ribosomal peptide synthetase component F
MLGILEAGGAILPCDPAHLAEQRRDIIHQTGSTIVVTSMKHADLCAGLAENVYVLNPVTLAAPETELLGQKDFHHDNNSAAYIIFTRGRTGSQREL